MGNSEGDCTRAVLFTLGEDHAHTRIRTERERESTHPDERMEEEEDEDDDEEVVFFFVHRRAVGF